MKKALMTGLAAVCIITVLSGCCEKEIDVPEHTPFKECYTFDRNISLSIGDLNATHGTISWIDVTKVENFLEAKKQFNRSVEELNLR